MVAYWVVVLPCDRSAGHAILQASDRQAALEARLAEATEQLAAARADAADMKGIMADTARILEQKNAEVRICVDVLLVRSHSSSVIQCPAVTARSIAHASWLFLTLTSRRKVLAAGC